MWRTTLCKGTASCEQEMRTKLERCKHKEMDHITQILIAFTVVSYANPALVDSTMRETAQPDDA